MLDEANEKSASGYTQKKPAALVGAAGLTVRSGKTPMVKVQWSMG